MRIKFHKKGFTIIELLVVSAIIAVLALIVIVSYTESKKKSRDSRRVVDMNSISSALALYYDENKKYAPDITGCDTSKGYSNDCNVTVLHDFVGNNWGTESNMLYAIVPNYIDKLPVDPLNKDEYFYIYEPASVNAVGAVSQYGANCPQNVECAYMLSAKFEITSNNPLRDAGCNLLYPEHDYCIVAGGAKPHE
jgi:prepilin-type N-terminal cleavage/methylation domain-containing protein